MKKKEAKQSGAFFRELSTVVREHATYGKISSPDLATEFIEAHYGDATREHFGVILLDSRHAVIGYSVCSIGTANSSLVHPRETFTIAIREQAAAIIVWHNHPSGDTSPSSEDLAITKRLARAGKILGIAVLDHLIVSKGAQTYSMQSSRPDRLEVSDDV